MKHLSDADIMKGVQSPGASQTETLTFLYWKLRPMISKHVSANGGSQDDALDVLQEGIIAFVDLSSRGKFRGESSISTFIFGICKRIWLNQLKRKRINDQYQSASVDQEAENSDIPDLVLMDEEKKNCWEQLMGRCGADCKEIISYRYTDGYSLQEIAEIMGFKNDQNARNKLYKCKQEFKNQLIQFQAESPDCSEVIFAA